MAKRRYGICPKCFEKRHLTKHHILPKRFFGFNQSVLYLCQSCHSEIEIILPLDVKLEAWQYKEIHRQWLRDQHPVVITRKWQNKPPVVYARV